MTCTSFLPALPSSPCHPPDGRFNFKELWDRDVSKQRTSSSLVPRNPSISARCRPASKVYQRYPGFDPRAAFTPTAGKSMCSVVVASRPTRRGGGDERERDEFVDNVREGAARYCMVTERPGTRNGRCLALRRSRVDDFERAPETGFRTDPRRLQQIQGVRGGATHFRRSRGE